MKKIIFISSLIFSFNLFASDIAFGTINGIKLYDFSNNKSIKVYFNAGASHVNALCVKNNSAVAVISKSNHDAPTIDRMLTMLIAAQMSGKKVRMYAEKSGCEADFVAIQESYF